MAEIIAIHDRSLCCVNKRLRINVDRFNSPESCIKFLSRKLKNVWFVKKTWDTIFDIMRECTDT